MRRLLVVLAIAACGHHSGTGGNDGNGSGPPSPVIVQCPGCPAFPGLGTDASSACGTMAQDPQLVYPPDQVLVPPNMNVIELQFEPGAGNTLFEIDFENAATDVRVETMCNADHQHARRDATNGCVYDLIRPIGTTWRIEPRRRSGDITCAATDAERLLHRGVELSAQHLVRRRRI